MCSHFLIYHVYFRQYTECIDQFGAKGKTPYSSTFMSKPYVVHTFFYYLYMLLSLLSTIGSFKIFALHIFLVIFGLIVKYKLWEKQVNKITL